MDEVKLDTLGISSAETEELCRREWEDDPTPLSTHISPNNPLSPSLPPPSQIHFVWISMIKCILT